MELYGGSAAQTNSQTEITRQMNQNTIDFNNSLAEKLDEANLQLDEDAQGKLQKNILSGVTSGGKLLTQAGAVEGLKKGATKLGVTFKKPAAGAAEGAEGAEGAVGESVEAAAPVAEREGAAVGERVIGTSAAALAEKEAAAAATKLAFKEGLTTVGKTAIAGLGGGLDIASDINNIAQGKIGWDTFGSNTSSRFGNIANIVGSGLEVAGVLSGGVTPWGLGLEAIGAGISLVGSGFEAAGDVESSDKEKETTDADIQSQRRGLSVAEQVSQTVGRTE
jgi:hypothetical protein